MPRRPPIDPPTRLEIALPESERTWLDLHLWSDVEGRVPFGAHRQWFLDRLHEYRSWKSLDLAPYGFPPGMYVKGPEEVIRRLAHQLAALPTT